MNNYPVCELEKVLFDLDLLVIFGQHAESQRLAAVRHYSLLEDAIGPKDLGLLVILKLGNPLETTDLGSLFLLSLDSHHLL